MPVEFLNYEYKYNIGNGKPVFVPSDRGRKIGLQIKQVVERNFELDSFFYHMKRGGHVAALHAHRPHMYFGRIDIENFFYSIGRNKVTRALHEIGIEKARTYGKWSCVKNPYDAPAYALPYGFVQSPLLATLVLAKSGIGPLLRRLTEQLTISVFVDDISLSGDRLDILQDAYLELSEVIQVSGFAVNRIKSTAPTAAIQIFHCQLTHNRASVCEARRAIFYSDSEARRALQASRNIAAQCAQATQSLDLNDRHQG